MTNDAAIVKTKHWIWFVFSVILFVLAAAITRIICDEAGINPWIGLGICVLGYFVGRVSREIDQ